MSNTAKVTEGISVEHLADVYSDPYIARIRTELREFGPVLHDSAQYLTATVGDEFCGAFLAIRVSSVEIDVHALLKRSAVFHSRELGLEFLRWAFSNPILRVTAYIVEGMESVVNYCLKLGFIREGFRRMACVKDGSIRGVHVLGITRFDWGTKWAS